MSAEALKQAVTKQNNPVNQFRAFLDKGKAQMAAALPKHLNADRMARLALTEFAKTPALQKCDPVSIFGAIIQASQLGLEIGVMGHAYLVPYRNNKTGKTEAQFIPGYKGLIDLARRTGEITSIETHIVHENDEFELALGLDTKLVHKPRLDGDRGAMKLVYGVAKFKDGGHHFEWMPIGEVNEIRKRSKASAAGPWVTDYGQMVRKTVIRRMANYLPMSVELANAIAISDAVEDGKAAALEGSFVIVSEEGATDEAESQGGLAESAPDWPRLVDDAATPEEREAVLAQMGDGEVLACVKAAKDKAALDAIYLALPKDRQGAFNDAVDLRRSVLDG